MTVGGDETSPEKRRRSGEGRFSTEVRKSLDFPRKLASLRRKSREVSVSTIAAASTVIENEESALDGEGVPKVEVAYLLVSPLLPPISTFTAFPIGIGALRPHNEENYTRLSASPTLAVFGNDDMFTSGKKLRKWAQDISSLPMSKFKYVEVAEAGHFWRSHAVQNALRIAIQGWIRGLSLAAV